MYCTIVGFVAIVGMKQTNSLSLLKAEQTTVELTALLFMLNLCSTIRKPLSRNSFLLVYELRTATLNPTFHVILLRLSTKVTSLYCQRRNCIYTYIYIGILLFFCLRFLKRNLYAATDIFSSKNLIYPEANYMT